MTRSLVFFSVAFGSLLFVLLAAQPSIALTGEQMALQQVQPTSTPQPTGTPLPPGESGKQGESSGPQPDEGPAVDWANLQMAPGEYGNAPNAGPYPGTTAVPPKPTPTPGGPSSSSDQSGTSTTAGALTHTVLFGETLFSIASSYGMSWPQLATFNNIQNPDFIYAGQILLIPAPGGNLQQPLAAQSQGGAQQSGRTYTVQPGDKPYEIAQRFGVSVQLLMTVNHIENPRRLQVGQVLIIPGATDALGGAAAGQPDTSAKPAGTAIVSHYVVQWGDSLFGIAVSYGVPMQSLVEANKLDSPDRIYAGQTLAIPGVSADSGLAISTAQTLPQPASESGFIWPVPLEDGWIPKWYRLDHPGIDIILTEGTQIRAAAAGTVEFSGWNNQGFGNLVVINHGNGYRTLYAHQSERLVVEGQTVAQGDVIGLVGMTGNATDPHLHFEIRVGYDPVNPCDYLPGGCLK